MTTLIVDAIEHHGQNVEVARLALWLWLCTDRETSLHRYLESDSIHRLNQWQKDHPEQIKQVMLHLVEQGRSSWEAQNRFVLSNLPPEMGAFWLQQLVRFQANGEDVKARDCLETAAWWLDQEARGISLEDLETAVQHNTSLQIALRTQLTSTLDETNWRRKNWLRNQKHRDADLATAQLNERNRIYLLDHLDDVRYGKQHGLFNELLYTVQAGDTLGKIAAQQLDAFQRWPEILRKNPHLQGEPARIRAGQTLRIPA